MLRHFLVQQCIPTLQCVAFCLVMLPNPHAWCQLGKLTKQCPTFGSLPLITHCTARPGLVLLTHLRLSHRHCLLLIITAISVNFTRRSSENISLLFLPSLRFWWAKDQLSNLATFKSKIVIAHMSRRDYCKSLDELHPTCFFFDTAARSFIADYWLGSRPQSALICRGTRNAVRNLTETCRVIMWEIQVNSPLLSFSVFWGNLKKARVYWDHPNIGLRSPQFIFICNHIAIVTTSNES